MNLLSILTFLHHIYLIIHHGIAIILLWECIPYYFLLSNNYCLQYGVNIPLRCYLFVSEVRKTVPEFMCHMCYGKEDRGGAGSVCAKEIIQGMEFVNQRLEISRINYFDRCWGGGLLLSRMLSSIPYPNICGSMMRNLFRQTVLRPFPCSC